MPAVTGRDLVVKKNSVAIAGVQTTGLTIDNSPVNITDIADDGFRTLGDFSGERSMDLSVDGVWKDTVVEAIAYGADSGLLLTDITIDLPSGGSLAGDFFVANWTLTGTHNEAATYSATLQSSGDWTYTAPA